MPLPGDVRKQVLVQVRTDGEGLAEKLAVELANAQAKMIALQNEIASGNTTVQLSQRDWKALNTEISFLSKELTKASAAFAQSDPEFARYQERLREMAQEAANAAAEIEEKSRREVAAGLNAVRSRVAQIREQEAAEEAQALAAKKADDVREAARFRAEQAAIKDAERQAKLVEDYIADQARKDEAAAKADIREAERQAKLVEDYLRDQARKDEAAERLAIKDAERQAKLIEDYEADESRRQQARDTQNLAAANWILKNSIAEGSAALAENTARLDRQRDAIRTVMTSTDALTASKKRAAQASDDGGVAAGRFSYGLLNIAHAAQDAQYGLGAVLNNIPLVVQALGGGGLAAGGLMMAGTAFATMGPSFREISVALGYVKDAAELSGGTVTELKTKLQALQDKRFKVTLDYIEIEDAKRKLDDLIQQEEAYKAGKKTPEERYQEDKGGEAVKVVSTKTIAHNLRVASEQQGVDVADQSTLESLEYARKSYKNLLEREKTANWFDKNTWLPAVISSTGTKIAALEAKAEEQRKSYYEQIAGGFAMGKTGAVQIVRAADESHPGLFTKDQSQAIRTVPYTEEQVKELAAQVTPAAVREQKAEVDRQIKMSHQEKEDKAERIRIEGAAATERDNAIRQAATTFGTEMPTKLPDSLDTAVARRISKGESNETIMKGLLPQVKQRVENSGVDKDLVGEVADAVITAITAKIRTAAAARAQDVKQGATQILEDVEQKATDAAQRGENKEARNQKMMGRQEIAKGMQEAYGLTDEQAQVVAPQVEAEMKRGMSPQAAGQAAVARLQHYITEQQTVILEMQANFERMANTVGPATMMLGQMRANNARLSGMINQAGRGANGQGMFPIFPPR